MGALFEGLFSSGAGGAAASGASGASAGAAAGGAAQAGAAASGQGFLQQLGAPAQLNSANDIHQAFNFANQFGPTQQQQQPMQPAPISPQAAGQFAQGLQQGPNMFANLQSFMNSLVQGRK